jgi:HlyD family secretion protein
MTIKEETPKQQEVKSASPLSKVEQLQKFVDKFVEKESIKTRLKNFILNLDFSIDYITKENSTTYDRNPVLQSARGPIRFGILVITIFFLTFGIWGTFARISTASHSSYAVLVSSSNRKVVQHLESGIIKEIYVKNGDKVKAGDRLLLISDARSDAESEHHEEDHTHLMADLARLLAQRDRLEQISYPKEITDNLDQPNIKTIYDSQEKLFHSTMNSYKEQKKIGEAKIESAKKAISGLKAQNKSAAKQLQLNEERLKSITALADDGYASKAQLAEAESKFYAAQGNAGDLHNKILQAEQQLYQAQSEASGNEANFETKIASEIHDVKIKLSATNANAKTTKDQQSRKFITASIDGVIHNFFYTTQTGKLEYYHQGSVIQGGVPIMDIIPNDDELEVDAKINPADIDAVLEGMETRIHIEAYRGEYVPDLIGKVIYVSRDISRDFSSQQGPYYGVRVAIDQNLKVNPSLKKLKLQPGMIASVTIVNGYKSFFGYLLDPLLKSFRKSFSER